MAKFSRRDARKRRHNRSRQHIVGTAQRPRLNVYRSLNHIHAQIIDDSIGHTLVSASSVEPELRAKLGSTGNKEAAKQVGLALAERAKSKDISEIVFDRGGQIYHGRIASLAEGAREGGLVF